MTLSDLNIDKTWSLFLDRDGVINRRIPGDYVKKWEEFEFLPGTLEAIAIFTEIFRHIFVVTNQQGIGKGIMTETELEVIHDKMIEEIRYEGGHIHKVYHSPYRDEERSVFRKPNTGMARKAKIDYPSIDFNKSMMIGDSMSDMEFGRNAGMITCYISSDEEILPKDQDELVDFLFPDLLSLAQTLTKI
ncbi:MAG: HAD family hydrolase [Bacteroidetes bacterium]|nr:HAD family hydrolase [Bacteroidota bacterium]